MPVQRFHKAMLSICFPFLSLFLCQPVSAGLFVETAEQSQLLHDGNLHIFILGTGNPECAMQEIRKPSCLAVIVDGDVLLIDAGEGAIQTIAGLGIPYAAIDKIFMTHWHSDHFGGLGQVINASWLHGRKKRLTVYGPRGTKEVLSGLEQAYRLDTEFRTATLSGVLDPNLANADASVVDATEDGVNVYQKDDLKVSAFLVKHTPVVPALGYVIRFHAAKIVISGDTCVVQSLAKQSNDADILISEVFSRPLAEREVDGKLSENVVKDLSGYHADSLALAKMAQLAGVKHLVLTHLVPSIPTTEEAKKAFIEGMPAIYSGRLTVAGDRDHIVVKPGKVTGSDKDSGKTKIEIEYIPYPQPLIPVVPRPKGDAPMGRSGTAGDTIVMIKR